MVVTDLVGRSFMTDDQRAAILEELPEQGNVLEIGTGHGTTVAWWAQRRPAVTFVTVDNFEVAPGTGPGDIEDWLTNHQPNQLLFRGTSAQFGAVALPVFDAIFIDGDHSYEGCMADLILGKRLVVAGGKLMLHDYGRMEVPSLRGVTKAADTFCPTYHWTVKRVLVCTAVMEAG